jgi:uridine kinase
MKRPKHPLLVAIVGGSGSGKSRLADELQAALGSSAGRLWLDDFYRDRSHLSPARRARINFDEPKAIDWTAFERALNRCFHWRNRRIPRYDFNTHCRLGEVATLKPQPIMLVDGLWLLRIPRIRRFFGFRIFIDRPAKLRLQRRLARDSVGRGRSAKSVREQFRKTVEPMHRKYVAPQIRWADIVFEADWGKKEVKRVVMGIGQALENPEKVEFTHKS